MRCKGHVIDLGTFTQQRWRRNGLLNNRELVKITCPLKNAEKFNWCFVEFSGSCVAKGMLLVRALLRGDYIADSRRPVVLVCRWLIAAGGAVFVAGFSTTSSSCVITGQTMSPKQIPVYNGMAICLEEETWISFSF